MSPVRSQPSVARCGGRLRVVVVLALAARVAHEHLAVLARARHVASASTMRISIGGIG